MKTTVLPTGKESIIKIYVLGILKSLVSMLLLTMISFAAVALLLSKTDVPESAIAPATVIISVIAVAVGGLTGGLLHRRYLEKSKYEFTKKSILRFSIVNFVLSACLYMIIIIML